MKTIHLEVTVDEANLLLEGLGDLPFARVYNLVAKLREQANQQMQPETVSPAADNAAPIADGDSVGTAPVELVDDASPEGAVA